jgi:hypothetical protein
MTFQIEHSNIVHFCRSDGGPLVKFVRAVPFADTKKEAVLQSCNYVRTRCG